MTNVSIGKDFNNAGQKTTPRSVSRCQGRLVVDLFACATLALQTSKSRPHDQQIFDFLSGITSTLVFV